MLIQRDLKDSGLGKAVALCSHGRLSGRPLWLSTQPEQTHRQVVAVQAAARAMAKHSAATIGDRGASACRYNRWWRTALLVILIYHTPLAQDMHMTQVSMSAWQINPAAQVLMVEQTRLTLQYRNQWLSVPVPYTTGAFTAERKWVTGGLKGWGCGLALVSDRAGDGMLFNRAAAATVGYSLPLASRFMIAAALQPRFGMRGVDISRLSFGEQYTGEYYDPFLPSGEPPTNWQMSYSSLAGGAALRYLNTGRIKLAEVGVAAYHINRPQVGFRNDVAGLLDRRTNLYAFVVGRGGLQSEWLALLLWQKQGASAEILPVVGYRYYLRGLQGWSPMISLEGGTRLGDAVFGIFSLHVAGFALSYSYDINSSAFVLATNRRGGYELALRYSVLPVLTPKSVLVCPVF